MADFVETRQLATTLQQLSSDTSNLGGYRKGTIVSIEDGPPSTCTITLSGDPTEIPGIAYLDSYTPVVDETVIIGKQGGSLLILGTTEHNGGGGGGGYTPPPSLSLVRSTAQSIPHNTFTAISWSSQLANIEGPGTWWASGSPTQIVMPWAGLYRVTINCAWDNISGNARMVFLNSTTTLSYANMVNSNAITAFSSSEPGAHTNLECTLNVASASDVYVVGVIQDQGAAVELKTRHAQVPAMATFTYLDSP